MEQDQELDMVQMYDIIDGGALLPALAGTKVPAPPRWVREMNVTPRKYQFFSLAAVMKPIYPPTLRGSCVEYLRRYVMTRNDGRNLVVVSTESFEMARTVAAMLSEFVMRYRPFMDLTTQWFDVPWGMRWVLDNYKKSDNSEYMMMSRDKHSCNMLWVNDLLKLEGIYEGRWFINSLYSDRSLNLRPTVTTIHVGSYEKWEHQVKKIIGRSLFDQLLENAILVVCDERE